MCLFVCVCFCQFEVMINEGRTTTTQQQEQEDTQQKKRRKETRMCRGHYLSSTLCFSTSLGDVSQLVHKQRPKRHTKSLK